ncbi:hypothetical protein [Vibrio sonorensis]|uniref:hypothetical protein n=1 Tax=Vibrio sonorensis TaxID=1004316 RepID=UPI0008D923F6|nr:hypothetical protein [Vibrio sonorensis]
MTDKHTPLADALAKAIQIDTVNNVRKEVERIVVEKCMSRGFISKQDEDSASAKYQWVKKVFRNDYEALMLRRKTPLKVGNMSDLSSFNDELDYIAEQVIDSMAQRLLLNQIFLAMV